MRSAAPRLLVCALLSAMLSIDAAAGGGPPPDAGVAEALDANRETIMALPGVVGVGLSRCESEVCIRVFATRSSPELEQALDRVLGEHPYVVELTEPVEALPSE